MDAEHAAKIEDDAGVRFLKQYKLLGAQSCLHCLPHVRQLRCGRSSWRHRLHSQGAQGQRGRFDACARPVSDCWVSPGKKWRESSNEEWIRRNYRELSARFDGKYLAFVDQTRLTKEEAKAGRSWTGSCF